MHLYAHKNVACFSPGNSRVPHFFFSAHSFPIVIFPYFSRRRKAAVSFLENLVSRRIMQCKQERLLQNLAAHQQSPGRRRQPGGRRSSPLSALRGRKLPRVVSVSPSPPVLVEVFFLKAIKAPGGGDGDAANLQYPSGVSVLSCPVLFVCPPATWRGGTLAGNREGGEKTNQSRSCRESRNCLSVQPPS
jgi:hypothetical protein